MSEDELWNEWQQRLRDTFEPEQCPKCKKPMRLPRVQMMAELGRLYCPRCRAFHKRTKK